MNSLHFLLTSEEVIEKFIITFIDRFRTPSLKVVRFGGRLMPVPTFSKDFTTSTLGRFGGRLLAKLNGPVVR